MLNRFHGWILSWPFHDLHILLCQKSTCHVLCGTWHCPLDMHKVSFKNARRPGKHIIPEKPDVALVAEGYIQHHQFTPPTRVDGTPYMTEGAQLPSMGWMWVSISLFPCPRRTRTWPSLWNSVKRGESLKTQSLQCLRSHWYCLQSKVNSMPRTDNLLPNRQIISTSPNDCPWPFGSTNCPSAWAMVRFLRPVLNRQSARQTWPIVAATWMTYIPVSPDAVLPGPITIHHSVG